MPTTDLVPIRRALLSVSDKRQLVELARALHARGVEIISTGGTAKVLREANVPTIDIGTYTGFTEMLDGRVKTLHPKVHGGLLGRRDDTKHVTEMKNHNIETIDLVVVNLYPFEKIAGQADAHWDELIENIDIGGPAMLRSAAKNHDAVCVLSDPSDYAEALATIELQGGTTHEFRRRLALRVFERTSRYDGAIAQRLALKVDLERPGDQVEPSSRAGLGPLLSVSAQRAQPLRYGENPHQMAAVYTTATSGIDLAGTLPLQGKQLSYNNLLDADAAIYALRCLTDGLLHGAAAGGACVIVKHNTPCGAARAPTLLRAYQDALAGDPTSAFGGIVAVSDVVSGTLADLMAELFLEVVVAPAFSDDARAVFAKKPAVRLLELGNLATGALPKVSLRSICGGVLAQQSDGTPRAVTTGTVVTKRAPTDAQWRALDVAFRLCAPVKSNAITLVQGEALIGVGGGQTSRVDSVRLAVSKALANKHSVAGAALGSDAFFPFPDGVVAAAEAGVRAIAQPGGSKKDDEVVAAADALDIAMVMVGERHFRH